MTYEETAIDKKPSKTAIHKAVKEDLDKFSTGRIVWHLIKRHKFGLTAAYAGLMTVLVVAPFLPGLLFSYMTQR